MSGSQSFQRIGIYHLKEVVKQFRAGIQALQCSWDSGGYDGETEAGIQLRVILKHKVFLNQLTGAVGLQTYLLKLNLSSTRTSPPHTYRIGCGQNGL